MHAGTEQDSHKLKTVSLELTEEKYFDDHLTDPQR